MKHFVALLFVFVALVAIVAPANAAMTYDGYATGPGGFSTPYPAVTPDVYAGLIEINYGSHPVLMMSDDHANRVNVGDSWTTTLYTQADIAANAPVKYTAGQYGRAAAYLHILFPMESVPNSWIRTAAGIAGNDGLASINTAVWDIMSSTSCPTWWTDCTSADTFNWSGSMLIAGGRDEYLIPVNVAQAGIPNMGIMGTTPSVPVPPAVWLFGSGLIALVGISRRKK